MIELMFFVISMHVGIDTNLIKSICWVESNHRNVNNINDGGSPSYGICQIKLKTANWMREKYTNVKPKLKPEDLSNSFKNIFYSALYIKYQLKRYKNNLYCAISSYNAGRCIRSNKKYVDKVLNRMLFYKITKKQRSQQRTNKLK